VTTYAIIGVIGLVLVFLVWLAFRYARRAGEAAAERDQFQVKSEQARRANEIDEDVARTPIADIDNELRNGG
jgi:hypothetical protein